MKCQMFNPDTEKGATSPNGTTVSTSPGSTPGLVDLCQWAQAHWAPYHTWQLRATEVTFVHPLAKELGRQYRNSLLP